MWLFNNKELLEEDIPEGAIGFIYIISSELCEMKYVGRKLLTKAGVRKKVVLKEGEKKKRQAKPARKASDWANYYGSCDELKADIKRDGKENYKREILGFYNSVSTLNYSEAKEQFDRRVLERPDYYNGNIMIRSYKKNIIGKIK